MTDDRTLADIDARGRAAASGVRTAVADRPAPAFDPDLVRIDVDARSPRPRRSRPLVGLVAAAAAVLVVLAGAVALVSSGDDDSSPAEETGPAADGRYRLGEVPDGFVVAGLSEGPAPGADEYGQATLYGPDAAHPRLAVGTMPDGMGFGCSSDDGDDCASPSGEDVPDAVAGLDEVPLQRYRAWDASTRYGGALLVEVGDDLVLVAGASLSPEELRRSAEGIAPGDRPTVPASHLPEGFAEIDTAPLLSVMGSTFGIVFSGRGGATGVRWALSYGPSDPSDDGLQMISVSAAAGSEVEVGMGGVLVADAEDVTVRGAAGQITRSQVAVTDATVWSVRWQEQPGEVVELVVGTTADRAFTREQVLDLAEGIVPVDEAGVAEIRQVIADRGLDRPGVTVVGEGTFSDGETWRLVHGLGDAELGVSGLTLRTQAVPTGMSTSSATSSEAGPDGEPASEGPVGSEAALVDGDPYAWAFGPVTAPDVVAVEVRRGGALLATATVVRTGDLAGWVAELPPGLIDEGGSDELVVVAFDAAGTELGRMSF